MSAPGEDWCRHAAVPLAFPPLVADGNCMTLLQKRDTDRRARRLSLHAETRRALQAALRDLLPEVPVYVFGSLLRPGVFNDASDIDLALTGEPASKTVWLLQAELEERLHRPVDLILLPESRLRHKIVTEGELWMT
jgi:predicted nucleotidyltransferase